jgi:hypothetical protein
VLAECLNDFLFTALGVAEAQHLRAISRAEMLAFTDAGPKRSFRCCRRDANHHLGALRLLTHTALCQAMASLHTHDAFREAKEFREQLSSDRRRLIFLFGAGTSMAVGIEGIAALTQSVRGKLSSGSAAHYNRLLSELGDTGTVEDVLNVVRLCRELLTGDNTATARGLTGDAAGLLDREICKAIYDRISVEPPGGFDPYVAFATWVRSITRAYPIEVFTTNYDVLIERGLERTETPHFDGFVGSYEPYFSAASVEAELGRGNDDHCAPAAWVRVWKMHGSIGWRMGADGVGKPRIIRSRFGTPDANEEYLVYPSRQKYADSRKQPYVAYHDRLRRVLSAGEVLLVTVGYSFGDQHINEILFEALRANNRLAVTALIYSDLSQTTEKNLLEPTLGARNLTVYAADAASVGGVKGSWSPPPAAAADWPFWDFATHSFTLGNFRKFAEYLRIFLSSRAEHHEPSRPVHVMSTSHTIGIASSSGGETESATTVPASAAILPTGTQHTTTAAT